jgi:3-methyladenine DNA glycosylase AlkD
LLRSGDPARADTGSELPRRHDAVPDREALLPLISGAATDPRNLVKKAVNWALRAIGKRNPHLRRAAIAAAENIRAIDSPAARWIASDALRELRAAPRRDR